MNCKKCPVCGLVLDNHDYPMAINCVQDTGTTFHELAMSYLRKYKKMKFSDEDCTHPSFAWKDLQAGLYECQICGALVID